MTTKTDGGPAFPGKRPFKYYSMGEHQGVETVPGMTLRDYFAAKAMQGLMPIYWETQDMYANGKELIKCQVETAYEYADAMLIARENKS